MATVITLSSDTESATDSATDVEVGDRWALPTQLRSSPPPSLSPPPPARVVETIEISDDDEEDEEEESRRGRGGSQPPSWSYGRGSTGPASSPVRLPRPAAYSTVDYDGDDVVDLSAAPSAELLPATNSWDSVAWGRAAAAGTGAAAAAAAPPPPAPPAASSSLALATSSDGLGPDDDDDDDDFWCRTGGSMPLPRLHSSAAPSSDLDSDLDGTSASLPASLGSAPAGRRRGAGKASGTSAAARKVLTGRRALGRRRRPGADGPATLAAAPAAQAEAEAKRAAKQAEKAAAAEARQREREARKVTRRTVPGVVASTRVKVCPFPCPLRVPRLRRSATSTTGA